MSTRSQVIFHQDILKFLLLFPEVGCLVMATCSISEQFPFCRAFVPAVLLGEAEPKSSEQPLKAQEHSIVRN